MDKWDQYVQKKLSELHQGAPIPKYFGTAANLFQESGNIFFEDDAIIIPKKEAKTPKVRQLKERIYSLQNNSQSLIKTRSFQSSRSLFTSDNADEMSEDSTPITKSEVISPSEDEDNFDNIIEDENVVDIQEDDNEIEEYNTPAYEGSDVDDEIFPKELDEEESFQSNNKDEDKQAKSYATSFREIGDHIFGQYWFPIDTVIPRLTMDSKLMVTFRTSNFNRLKRLITDAKPPTNKLHFIRVTNSDF